jgi:hypothetical protein
MKILFAIAAAFFLANPANAELPSGKRKIILKSETENLEIGTVTFEGTNKTRKISIVMKDEIYHDEFLSMRPFKCIESTVRYYCHLPYPYEWKGEISETDLVDLEYALLFVQKQPTAYGINLWNGIYYQLKLEADGKMTGVLNEVDMDTLASPPPKGEMRPINKSHINAASPEGQWLPKLVIE